MSRNDATRQSPGLVTLGHAVWDYLAIVDHIPVDGKTDIQAVAEQGGGPTSTAAVAAVALGVPTAFIGAVGSDAVGHHTAVDLADRGVDISHLHVRDGQQTSFAYVWVEADTGRRSIAWFPGSVEQLRPSELPRELLAQAELLHLDGMHTQAALQAAEIVHAHGGAVSLDAGSYRPRILELLPVADIVIASRDFAAGLVGKDAPEKALRRLAEGPAEVVGVTLGADGCIFLVNDEVIRRPAFSINAVDTTGAGDVFHGAFCAGWLQKLPMTELLDYASAAAALKCRGLGGRTSIPDASEVDDLLKQAMRRGWMK